MADYPISNVPRRIVFAADGVGPYAFTFEILTQTDIAVFKDNDLLELTTDYSVTINPDGTGSVLLNVAPVGATQIALVGARAIERVSDFTTGGDFFAATVNEELDSLTIFAQQNAEAVVRALKAPQTDPLDINMTLPRRSDRIGKYLVFDENGNPAPGEIPEDVAVVFAIRNEIEAVAAIDSQVVTVAGISADVTTVAGIAANVTTVAGISANVTTVAGNTANINAVAAQLGTDLDVTIVADDLRGANNIGAVGGSIANVDTVAGIETDVTTLAGIETEVVEVSENIIAVNAVGSDLAGLPIDVDYGDLSPAVNPAAPVGALGSVYAIRDEIVDVAAIDADVPIVAGIAANVTTVAGVASDVTIVSGVSVDVATVAGIATDVSKVAAIDADVSIVAAIDDKVVIAADNVADITNFADVYQGPKASDPATRNDGSALQLGDLYFNTALDDMKVFTSTGWQFAYLPANDYLLAANNLSDLDNVQTARDNLGLSDMGDLT
jgi:hypothetical protein